MSVIRIQTLVFQDKCAFFFQFHDSKFCNNKKPEICHSEFVFSCTEELLKNGIILQVNDVLHEVNLLTVM